MCIPTQMALYLPSHHLQYVCTFTSLLTKVINLKKLNIDVIELILVLFLFDRTGEYSSELGALGSS